MLLINRNDREIIIRVLTHITIKFNTDGELTYSKSSSTTYKLYMEAQVNYARKFGLHDITAMVLYNQNDYQFNSELAKRYQGIVGRVTA